MLVKNKTLLFWIVLLSCIYFVLRITSALTIHFFSDEADYIYFAFQAMTQKGMAFISLSEGVKPLHAWLMIPFLSFFHNNLLFGARFLSILTGFFTMIGLYLLSNELFKKTKIGLLSMAVFILFPYAQIYNSLAVIEGTVGMFMVFSLYLLIKLVKKPNALNALSFGIATGLGILTKRQAFFNL